MNRFIEWLNTFFGRTLNIKSRLVIVLATLMLIPTFFLPLWKMTFWSYQYPDSLELSIYSSRLDSGDEGNHLAEINILNHYIGMQELEAEDFTEFKWIPLALVIFIFVALRAAVLGRMRSLVDAFFLFIYFGIYSIWTFGYRLYSYGHNLDPKAAVQIEPFTPPLFGYNEVGQFKVWSYPDVGTYFLLAFPLLLLVGVWLSRKERSTWHVPAGE